MERFEIICAAILVVQFALTFKWAKHRGHTALTLFCVAAAAWITENSVIHLYEFYQYAPRWSLFVDQMPLMVVLIWPGVFGSSRDLAGPPKSMVSNALLVGAIVISDAALIEPISVTYGLWSWNEPGIFQVPIIGILGWGIFAAGAQAWLHFARRRWQDALWPVLAVLILAPLWTHAVLLILWWSSLRWLSAPLPSWSVVAAAWLIALPLAWYLSRKALAPSTLPNPPDPKHSPAPSSSLGCWWWSRPAKPC